MAVSRRFKAELLLIVVTFVWGATFVIVKAALADASPLAFVAVRFTLAGLLLFAVFAPRGVNRSSLGPGTLLGLSLFGGYIFQTWGLVFTTPSKSAFITGVSVILVPLMTALEGARLRAASMVGAIAGLAGLYVVVAPPGASSINHGDLMTAAAATCFAVNIVLTGRYAQRRSFRELAPVEILCVGVCAAVALPFDRPLRLLWTPGLAGAIVITAVLATGFAFAVQNWAQQYTSPAHTALIFVLEPVFAALASRLVTGEKLGVRILAGSVLILAGMVISEAWGGSRPAKGAPAGTAMAPH